MTRKTLLVGKTFPRIEAEAKVTGRSLYLLDFSPTDHLLHGALVTSKQPHARLLAVDTEAARQSAGVVAVLTAEQIDAMLGTRLADRPVLARDVVRYVGEPIALVVAESPRQAQEAANKVVVRTEPLSFVADVQAATGRDAPVLHPAWRDYAGADTCPTVARPNVAASYRLQQGDMAKAWESADVVIEQVYEIPRRHHAALEPHAAMALQQKNGQIMLWATSVAPYSLQQELARALRLPPERLRVQSMLVGGGAGAKQRASIEALVVAAAMAVPEERISLVLNQQQEFTVPFVRPALRAYLKMGATHNGDIVAMQAHYQWDVGASADACLQTAWAAAYAGTGPYHITQVDICSEAVYTNHTPAAPMRGNDAAEIHWAIEQHIDQLAQAIGMDPLALRLHNMVKGGDRLALGEVMHVSGLEQCLHTVSQDIDWEKEPHPSESIARGKGLALFWSPRTVTPNYSCEVHIRLDEEGCVLFMESEDAGTGLHTFAAQLAASNLGLPLDWVQIGACDTRHALNVPYGQVGDEIGTVGNAVLGAVQRLRKVLLERVAEAWHESPNHIDIIDGVVISYATDREQTLASMFSEGIATPQGPVALPPLEARDRAEASVFFADDHESAVLLHFCAGAVGAEVDVNPQTGVLRIRNLSVALDVGHAINPDLVMSQIRGGALQGLGTALWEVMLEHEGVPQTTDLYTYHIPTFADLPPQSEMNIIEVPQDGGPYGARSLGADVPVVAAPAIANAIAAAMGARVTRLPLTSNRLWQALHAT